MFTTGLEELLEKTAARAGFRAMERAMRTPAQGGYRGEGTGGVDSLADLWRGRANWMKPTTKLDTMMPASVRAQGGKTFAELGGGGEGIADAVLHPRHGVVTRKAYDPQGMATSALIARKEQMGRRTGMDASSAQFFGAQATPQGGGVMHFNELVAGRGAHRAPAYASPADRAALEKTHTGVQAAAQRAGFAGGAQDVRRANMVWDTHRGQYRSIDAIPAKPGEFYPRDVHGNNPETGKPYYSADTGKAIPSNMLLTMNDSGVLADTARSVTPQSNAALRQQLLGKVKMPGRARTTSAPPVSERTTSPAAPPTVPNTGSYGPATGLATVPPPGRALPGAQRWPLQQAEALQQFGV